MHARSIATTMAVFSAAGVVTIATPGSPPAESTAQAAQTTKKHKGKTSRCHRVYMVRSKRPSGWRKVKRPCKGKRRPATPPNVAPGPAQSPPAAPVVRCDREAWPSTPEAVQRLADGLSAGQTGCLHAGTYDPASTYVLRISRGNVTIRSAPGEVAKLVGIVYVPTGRDHVTLSHLKIVGDGTQNAVKTYAANTTVQDSELTTERRSGSCMMLGSTAEAPAVQPIVRRNVLRDCGNPQNDNKDHGIYAASVRGGQIVDNEIRGHSGYATQFYPDAQGVSFQGNRVDGAGSIRGGVVFGGDGAHASSGNVVRRNVIVNAATYGVTTAWEGPQGTGNVAERNCMTNNRAGDVSSQAGFRANSNLSGGSECMARLAG